MRKANKESGRLGRFVALPHSVLDSPAYRTLSVYARALLIDIARQYTGVNNGSLLCSRAKMLEYGWKSADTLSKAKGDLLASNLLFCTVQGQRPNKASWYALTWLGLDKSDGYDPGTVQTFRRGAYMTVEPKQTREELYAKWRTPKTQVLDRHTEQEAA